MKNDKTPEMVEKKIPSALPFWIVGGFWVLYALIFPLYRLTHFLIAAVLSAAVFVAAKKLIPPRTVMVEAPKEAYDGKYDLGAAERDYLAKLHAASEAIDSPEVSAKVDRIEELSRSIFEYISQHPERTDEIHKFTSYYLPTTLKILDAYDRMEEQKIRGENVTKAMAGIEQTLGTVASAFERQLDSLYSAETLDIETDISVLESMLAQEGLDGGKGLHL